LLAGGTRFGLLGPLTLSVGDRVLPTPPAKERVVLAALLLKANRAVPLGELIEAVWGPDAPRSALGTLRDYVKELRKRLSSAGERRIATAQGGYLIRVGPGELDIVAFQESHAQATRAAIQGAWEQASGRWRATEVLWRGEPLADIPSELLTAREVPRLTELRLQSLESRLNADLHLGRHAEVIADLRRHTTTHPFRERLHALFMLALYRDSQQAAAQAVFRDLRQVLIDELGTEPGPELRQLHQQILSGDPALDLAPHVHDGRLTTSIVAEELGPPVIPRQLPAAVSHFTGRIAELEVLDDLLNHPSESNTVPISAIAGTAGVGKTALAVHWAHLVADYFPDGQLYANLRGYDSAEPMEPTEALGGFMRALGENSQNIPADPEERAARYRSRLAGRRVLIVLDNASSADQVRPLLPGGPSCAVLITSRDALSGLIARDGVRRLVLDPMPLGDATQLLQTLIGERAEADPTATRALAGCCARLPLALRIAAEFAARHPAKAIADVASELANENRRLDLLDAGGDPRAAVRAVFSRSYDHLDAGPARLFRLLGLHPGTEFDAYAAAALTWCPLEEVRHQLDVLIRAHLIQPVGSSRYSMHDLLKTYAAELAARSDERGDATSRLLNWYVRTAEASRLVMSPRASHNRESDDADEIGYGFRDFADFDQALCWLDAEHANLLRAVYLAARHGAYEVAWKLPVALWHLFDLRGNYQDWLKVYTVGLTSARHLGDRNAQAMVLSYMAASYLNLAQPAEAVKCLQECLELVRAIGDEEKIPTILVNLGIALTQVGRVDAALESLQAAARLFRKLGNRRGEAFATCNMAAALGKQGEFAAALGNYQQCMAYFREVDDLGSIAETLVDLSELSLKHARLDDAICHATEAAQICLRIGSKRNRARALAVLGSAERARGNLDQTQSYWHDAITIFTELGDPRARELETPGPGN
jgi:DNA-binding SARP family transcriptional activator